MTIVNRVGNSPCETCGACCAFFPVFFPNTEIDSVSSGGVPVDMTLVTKKSQRCMKGTQTGTPRCIALEGTVGVKVRCVIYETRPSTCRKFNLAWENSIANSLCDRARGVFGLQAFSQY